MSVGLDRKRLETPLIQVPRPAGCVVSVPTHRVHDIQATEELADVIAGFRLDDEGPVTFRPDPDLRSFVDTANH